MELSKFCPNPTKFFGSHPDLRYWAFHISVVDGFGFGRDSTFLSASFQPDVEKPWDFYQDRDLDWDFLAEGGGDVKLALPEN